MKYGENHKTVAFFGIALTLKLSKTKTDWSIWKIKKPGDSLTFKSKMFLLDLVLRPTVYELWPLF